jgi:hypothetical protein
MVPPTVRMPASVDLSSFSRRSVHQAAEAVAKADDLHAVKTERGFADAANGGVQAGAVAARRQDADAFGLGGTWNA